MEKDLKVRKQTVEVKGIQIEFEEYYRIDPTTKEELFDRKLEIENDTRLYNLYKKQKGLLTTQEIKQIRNKYGMNQKEYALSIGTGEITVHRFENGAIQTESVDSIMRLSNNPDNMCDLLIKNHMNLDEETYQKFILTVNNLQKLKRHCIAKYNATDFIGMDIDTIDVDIVASHLINKYNEQYDLLSLKYNIESSVPAEYITPLKLQKLLYYIQGLSLHIFKKPAFNNKIFAWSYGPVVNEIYQKFKVIGRNPIKNVPCDLSISPGLDNIIDIVIKSYGQIESRKLIDLTHNEEPWYNSKPDTEITTQKIRDYFNKIYDN